MQTFTSNVILILSLFGTILAIFENKLGIILIIIAAILYIIFLIKPPRKGGMFNSNPRKNVL